VNPDDLDLTADGTHAYAARLGDRSVRVTVEDSTLAELGLTAVEEPLLVRRTLELLPPEAVAGIPAEVTLAQLGAAVADWPLTAIARLRA
jgi:hypothetical protein